MHARSHAHKHTYGCIHLCGGMWKLEGDIIYHPQLLSTLFSHLLVDVYACVFVCVHMCHVAWTSTMLRSWFSSNI